MCGGEKFSNDEFRLPWNIWDSRCEWYWHCVKVYWLQLYQVTLWCCEVILSLLLWRHDCDSLSTRRGAFSKPWFKRSLIWRLHSRVGIFIRVHRSEVYCVIWGGWGGIFCSTVIAASNFVKLWTLFWCIVVSNWWCDCAVSFFGLWDWCRCMRCLPYL